MYGLKEGEMIIETLLKTGEKFATFIRITELNITAVPKIITLVVVVAWPYPNVCFSVQNLYGIGSHKSLLFVTSHHNVLKYMFLVNWKEDAGSINMYGVEMPAGLNNTSP